jgi:hypothetical protein
MLSKLFGKKQEGITGYLYVADCEEGILRTISEGKYVKNKKPGPPWFVIDHAINSMTVAKWPGSLWEAQIVDEAKNTGLLDYAKYSRANEIKVLRQLPLSNLFGKYGEAILKIISTASSINLDDVNILSALSTDDALSLYSKGWNIFGGTKNDDSPNFGRNHKNTIAMPGDEGCSPINNGFKIIYGEVFNRANELTNGEAIHSDEDGNAFLEPTWQNACNAFLCAAMAIAYQDKYTNDEIKTLSKAWEEVYGALPLKA